MGRTIEKIIVRNFGDMLKHGEGLIPKEQIRLVEVDAIVDTGATYVCLSRKDIESLGLLFHDSILIHTANGKTRRRTFKGAEIELNGRTFVMEVMENNDGTPALIGYLLLEALDFVVDPKSQKIIPNPAHEGEWVADLYQI